MAAGPLAALAPGRPQSTGWAAELTQQQQGQGQGQPGPLPPGAAAGAAQPGTWAAEYLGGEQEQLKPGGAWAAEFTAAQALRYAAVVLVVSVCG
jgi:hypothetical protein